MNRSAPGLRAIPPAAKALAAGDLGILILAPTGHDARLTSEFLTRAGLETSICPGLAEAGVRIRSGCGALLIAEEAFAARDLGPLVAELEKQPSWSDLPLILITSSSESSQVRSRYLAALSPVGNISIIERPVRPSTLVSTCEVALRSRRRQYQVRDLLLALAEADRRKNEFLAMLAHELRNPLAAVSNAATLLAHADSEERDWAAGVIVRQSGQLSHLIDDLLDVSRITNGKIRLRTETIDAAGVLERACDVATPHMVVRQHQLLRQFSPGQLWVRADPTRLEQIIVNLLTNAAKYTPAGGRVELTARVQDDQVRIEVRDNGIGIAPARLPEMFTLFAQGERSIARSEGGLGIGLTIVKRLVEMHGGRIDASSAGPHCGSTFTVILPLTLPVNGAVAPASVAPRPAAPRRILIVDDNVDTAQSLRRLLARAGHHIAVAHDGLEALTLVRQHAPEIIVLDLGMPGMDGFEVARRLRAEPACHDTTLIAVTGYGQPEDRQRTSAVGFDHHLVKPVEIEALKALL